MVVALLVEDDEYVRRGMQLALRRHGHDVETAEDGEAALTRFGEGGIEVVILDVMLPGIDGFEVCRRIRESAQTPIIMLTARADDFDIISGLEVGADDYVTKPVQPTVLDARIRAVLRRSVSDIDGVRIHGGLQIDTVSLAVTIDGDAVSLTPTELRLLLTLSRVPGQVLSREQLLEEVWEQGYLGDSRLVDNGVMRLRSKIERNPAQPEYVETVRGFGYRFRRA